jgi:hypothetical protein
MMDDSRASGTGRLAVAIGIVASGSAVALALEFAADGPFGTINDIGNGVAGVLSGALAWRLRSSFGGRASRIALASAMTGSALTVAGSALVVSGTTGWVLAGLVTTVGFAGIGAWVVGVNLQAGDELGWTRTVRRLGVAAGALMTVGVIAAPGILLRLDDPQQLPWWAWLGFMGWLGTFVVYPAWAFAMGLGSRRAVEAPIARPAG